MSGRIATAFPRYMDHCNKSEAAPSRGREASQATWCGRTARRTIFATGSHSAALDLLRSTSACVTLLRQRVYVGRPELVPTHVRCQRCGWIAINRLEIAVGSKLRSKRMRQAPRNDMANLSDELVLAQVKLNERLVRGAPLRPHLAAVTSRLPRRHSTRAEQPASRRQ